MYYSLYLIVLSLADVRYFWRRRGDIKERADVGYAADLDMMRERYARPKFDLVPLGSLTTLVQYGTSERSTTDGGGVPVLRIPNLQADGWDRKVSNWGRDQTPIFGSQRNAANWSNRLRAAGKRPLRASRLKYS